MWKGAQHNMASTTILDDTEVQVIRVLRCQKTRRFFSKSGWSEDTNQAEIFADEIDAVRACVAHNLDGIELVIRVDGSHTDLFCTTLR